MPRALKRQSSRQPEAASLLARVSFTGQLASITRKEARDIVQSAGGQTVSTVSRRTSMLVVGMDGWPLLPSGEIASKLQKAEELRAAGAPIRIASEEVFLEAAGLRERQPELRKTYTADQICSLVHIDRTTLARWEALGLIRSCGGAEAARFDFQDIISLRTIAELVHAGVKPDVIGRSIRRLASILPGTDRPLTQLKLVSERGHDGGLLAEIEGALVAPDGQILLNFDQPESLAEEIAAPAATATTRDKGYPAIAPPPRTLPLRDPDEQQLASADDWFERGCEMEEAGEYEPALEAYRRAVMLRAHNPEAHFNIANVLLALNRREAAEERFRVALEQDRTLAAAWYNLASVQEAAGRLNEAITSLKQAIHIAPGYADAQFNLASCYEQVGQLANAAHHWEQYLKLDSSSEWAMIARQRLRAIDD
jgi:tetratricopeptide (TPR) repeat protein